MPASGREPALAHVPQDDVRAGGSGGKRPDAITHLGDAAASSFGVVGPRSYCTTSMAQWGAANVDIRLLHPRPTLQRTHLVDC